MAHAGPALLALLVCGCSHAEPFAVSDPVQEGPFAPGAVVRLTYDAGLSPASWLAAGDSLVLTERDQDRREGDVCLFLLPAGGGTRQGGFCSGSHLQGDSIELFSSPAVSSERILAVTYRHQRLGGSVFGSIRTGPLATPFIATDVASLPFSLNGRIFQNATDLAWQADGSLVLLAWTDEILEQTCGGLNCDELIRIPYGAVRTAPGAGGSLTAVSGTYLATSVTPDGQGGLLTTYPASDQLWRVSAGGDSVAVHDFGPGSLPRDAHRAAGKVVVVTGGAASTAVDDIGVIQTSSGFGNLVVLDLASGTATGVGPANMLFRDPVLSPDGRSVVAIGSEFVPGGVPQFLRPEGDLWRISLP